MFESITVGIRAILDFLELVFVQTPWIVIASFIILLTGLSAGVRPAIFAGAFLAYMGFLGFWEKAMTTLALLGTAALISIVLGIPIGMFCARRPRVYAVVRPIMDFMQTMPAFVFMIPVIAFFGTGKPAAIVTTMIFGGTPVVRLTVLGLRGVPESIREAAIAYGATKWYLLTKVDLPLAAPSIRAGINQTIMLSLAMVVVASLIGAKGLGEDVLEALQYASVGQGILAGFAILFCALILDRVVQGRKRPGLSGTAPVGLIAAHRCRRRLLRARRVRLFDAQQSVAIGVGRFEIAQLAGRRFIDIKRTAIVGIHFLYFIQVGALEFLSVEHTIIILIEKNEK